MSTEKNIDPLHSANIRAAVDGQDQRFSPDRFSGNSSSVSMATSFDTHLNINYRKSLPTGTHTLTYTQLGVDFLDEAGRTFTHPTGGSLVVSVVGNNHNGTFKDLKVGGTGSGEGSELVLSGTYLIVVTP